MSGVCAQPPRFVAWVSEEAAHCATCAHGLFRCAKQLLEWITPGCEEWPEEAGRVDPAMAAAGLLRTRGQLEAQMSQLTVLLKAVELAAQSVDLDTQLRECDEEAYEEGKQKGAVAAAAAAAEGRRFICLSIASARGDLESLRAASRSLPQHGLGTLLVSASESQVKTSNAVTVAIVCGILALWPAPDVGGLGWICARGLAFQHSRLDPTGRPDPRVWFRWRCWRTYRTIWQPATCPAADGWPTC